jgi:DNA-binding transcriptional MerR regulator
MRRSVSEVAKILGLSVYTLHDYDREGLLPFVERDKNGARVFKDSDFRWLDLIMTLRNTGMTIKNIKQYLTWSIMGDSTIGERFEFINRQKQTVESQIEELKKYLELLEYKQWYYQTALDAGTVAVHADPGHCRHSRVRPQIFFQDEDG